MQEQNQVRWDRLAKWPSYLRNVPAERFDMGTFRKGDDYTSLECNTSGCVLGHMTKYAESPIPYYEDELNDFVGDWRKKGAINFDDFSSTELNIDQGSILWQFLFSSNWDNPRHSKQHQLEKAIERIEVALNHQHLDQDDLAWDELSDEYGYYEDDESLDDDDED